MKIFRLFPLAALVMTMALALSCRSNTNNSDDSGNGNYDQTDARTFGLAGAVKEVRISVTNLLPSDTQENILSKDNELQMSFNERGQVTLDHYGNVYEYDSDGKFVKGRSDITVVERDSKGRITRYENTPQTYSDGEDFGEFVFNYISLDLGYDEQGRVYTEEIGSWEAGYAYRIFYEGSNIYPQRAVIDGGEGPTTVKGSITYEYISFDEKGNWTERKVFVAQSFTEEGSSDEPTVENTERLEKRTILYY